MPKIFRHLTLIGAVWVALVAPNFVNAAETENARGIRCTEFSNSMIRSKRVNNVTTYVYTLVVKAKPGDTMRCTPELPPHDVCALSQVDGGGIQQGCEVSWATGMLDAGRWTLRARNESTGAADLTCSMICY